MQKKVAKSLEGGKKNRNFAGMIVRWWAISGRSRLTGEWQVLSLPMTLREAKARLADETARRHGRRGAAHDKLKLTYIGPKELALNFEDYETDKETNGDAALQARR